MKLIKKILGWIKATYNQWEWSRGETISSFDWHEEDENQSPEGLSTRWRGPMLRITLGQIMWFGNLEESATWVFLLPWARPLFGERYGFRKPVFSFLGFRLFVKQKKAP